MRASHLFSVYGTLALAAEIVVPEAADFNVLEALSSYGVDISTLPQAETLEFETTNAGCDSACSILHGLFQNQTDLQESPSYAVFTGAYWSQQQSAAQPQCVFKPASPTETAVSILLSRFFSCPFAVKSGGHAAFKGASGADGGISISLERLDEVSVSDDKSLATIGPGNTWHTVYTRLQTHDVVVVGGRVSSVGVGGLTLGGGISFFSNLYGWACDNIVSYEVVTSNGAIIEVSPDSYSDLYWALRGGGNNFGIVTSFRMAALPLKDGLIWGGTRISLEPEFEALNNAFYNMGTTGAESDAKAQQILVYIYYNSTALGFQLLHYAEPLDKPTVFDEYLKIAAYSDQTKIRTLADAAEEQEGGSPHGLRESYWTMTYKLTPEMVTYIRDVYFEEVKKVADAIGLVFSIPLQVITKRQIEAMARNGGNGLGLKVEDAPLLLLNVAVMWALTDDDDRIFQTIRTILDRTNQFAESKGWAHDYLYMNYASQWQDPVAGYGEDNKARLKSIARKYDPTEVFQKLQPGYFKLDGPPESSP